MGVHWKTAAMLKAKPATTVKMRTKMSAVQNQEDWNIRSFEFQLVSAEFG